jgi:putative nucleotidyltransferase with HDIG domain
MSAWWQKSPLAVKFVTIITFVVLLAGVLLGGVLTAVSSRAHLSERQGALSVSAKMLAVYLEEYMTRLMREMVMLGSVLARLPGADREETLRAFIVARPEVGALVFQSAPGEETALGRWVGNDAALECCHNGQPFQVRPASTAAGNPLLVVCYGWATGQHLAAQVNLQELSLQQGMLQIRLGESGHPYLLDGNGTVISHRHERYIGQNIGELVTMEDGRPGDVDLFTAASFSLLSYKMEGVERLAGVVPLQSLGLIVGFSQSISEIEAPVRDLRRLLLAAAALFTVLLTCLGMLLGSMVTRPLSFFVEQLEQIKNGRVLSVTGGGDSPEFGLARCAVNKLVARLHEMSVAAVSAVVLALEARDPATRGHSQRVARISCAIADTLGFGGRDLRVLARAALLHDVGKIAVPDRILLKRDKLSGEEREIICRHPEMAAKMLAPLTFLKEEIQIIRQHHERFDGSGYPLGLAGQDIHPLALVLTVADAYEAMTSDRPYRGAMSAGEALRRLAEGRNRQFDGRVVDALAEIMGKGFVFDKFPGWEEVNWYGFGQERA